jgi:hypothetical protein
MIIEKEGLWYNVFIENEDVLDVPRKFNKEIPKHSQVKFFPLEGSSPFMMMKCIRWASVVCTKAWVVYKDQETVVVSGGAMFKRNINEIMPLIKSDWHRITGYPVTCGPFDNQIEVEQVSIF